ncbi:HD-GYP domain-containing protein [Polynucleobacter sp. MWH-Braz-FAM2G]|uniref:HD-GYP domain-containing protein n=1 Tax=Polynucleobacter sp. MWH-Braz-FAM2G TaxID=1855883 RepID=UPI001BFD5036|nr:HD domain-containing phosphohydrolase [Polynucleobacter sp. MWH-Braz-FAM2G]QWD91672.1 HD domain-containing protein [Polynucleobacter sp. MWH-Braz-FAM2G]
MKYNPIRRLNVVLIASICVGEALIMFVLPSFGATSNFVAVLLDVLLLTLITIPLVKWLVIAPMKKYIQDLESANHTISAREDQMLTALNALAKAKDNETGSHIMRTQKYVNLLAKRLQQMGCYPDALTDHQIETLVKVAPLHDLGKVGIPDQVLNKQGRFTDEERGLMKSHPMIGETILAASQSADVDNELISTAMKVAGAHHEKWDGTGYPRQLQGEQIPIEARIMSVADVFDALVSDRPYKKGWSIDDAYQEIVSHKGSAFDPVVIDAFIAERKGFEKIAGKN